MNTAYPIKQLNHLRPILIGFRKEKRLTQKAISERLGVSQQAYARFESNPASASFERLFRVFTHLGIELSLSSIQSSTPIPSTEVKEKCDDSPTRREKW
ncbi:helix-turn-helix domain-containing protein [Enterobacter cloacae]|uniref:helix-turn-helix domain-containing protein n=1 Tax=Enterobacter TaxID=547 RepID=UPI0009080CF1|nr:helix-turn-helix transcriptional regulator [Enterobacter mori]MCG5128135.1 helix-turn-helix domain-containing protein [Enterobacter mori]